MENSDKEEDRAAPNDSIRDDQYLAWCYWHSLRAAALADPVAACARFGVDMPMTMLVATLALPELERLSLEASMVILRPRVTTKQLETILSAGRGRRPHAMRIAVRLCLGVPDGRPRASTYSSSTTGD